MSGTTTRQISLTPATILENATRVTIGEFALSGRVAGEQLTWTVDGGRFGVSGATLRTIKNSFDFERDPTWDITVTATDQDGNVFTQVLPITVLDVNEAPSIVSGPMTVTVREDRTAIGTYRGTDPDAGENTSYFLADSPDRDRFAIDTVTGALSFARLQNYEVRSDANRDRVYEVSVGISDGVLTDVQTVRVTLADVQEATDVGRLFKRKIDFAPATSAIGETFLVDTGQAYDDAVGYGWVTEASVADGTRNGTIPSAIAPYGIAMNERSDPTGLIDLRLRTYAHFEFKGAPDSSPQHWAWEHKLDNGSYMVRVALGDTGGQNDSLNVLNIEGRTVVAGFEPSSTLKTILVTHYVTVRDGKLTLDSIGGDNTEIQYIRIDEISPQRLADYAFVLPAVASIGGQSAVDLEQAIGIDPRSAFSMGFGNIDATDPIDPDSINSDTVRLIEAYTNVEVRGTVNTDAAGGTINFQPSVALKGNTTYNLVVVGVETVGGEAVLSETTSFATGPGSNETPTDVAFARQELDVSADLPYSSIVISPDGTQLYATTLAGIIVRWDIDPDTGVLVNEQTFAPSELAGRALIGIVFDPENPDVLWISNNDPLSEDAATDFTGKISRVTLGDGQGFDARVQDYIVGLPRSVRDHLSNSLAFHQVDGEWKLFLTQGSNSATGAPDATWGFRPERLLSAAVLEIDPDRDVSRGPIDVQTQDPAAVLPPGAGAQVGYYNPFAANAPVQLYATGVRNAYDLVWHSNGHLYVPTNGSAAGGNTPDDPNTAIDESIEGVGPQDDFLFDVREGFYYGHPNTLRGEYILNGGNPTNGSDENEVVRDSSFDGYPVGVVPPSDYDGVAYNFSRGRSPNGAIEYFSDAFGGSLRNALLVVEYSGGKDIVAIRFDAAGNVIDDDDQPFTLADARGTPLSFVNPLDLASDAESGRIYVLQLSNTFSGITLLTPTAPDVTPPQDRVLEAEDATIVGAIIDDRQPDFTGTGFVNFIANAGESITWTFEVDVAGVYTIGFRYALAIVEKNLDGRPLTLAVNGINEATLPFLPNARNFKEWSVATQDVEFHVGTNTVRLTSTGESGANVDSLIIAPDPVTAINTLPTIGGSQADLSFVVGAQIAFVLESVVFGDVDQGDVALLTARLKGGAPLPRWLGFDNGTNQFTSNQSEVPAPGIYEIEVFADDMQDESATSVTFAIEIFAAVDPADIDGDGIVNAADGDDDGDGVVDRSDPFQADALNGFATRITEGRTTVWDFEERPFGVAGGYAAGITGLHLSQNRTPEQLGLGTPNLTIGDGVLHIEDAGRGDLPTDDLTLGAQFGIDAVARFIQINATFDHPFDTRPPARGANFGLLIGTGDGDDYVKLVLEGQTSAGAFLQMETRQGGVRIDGNSPAFGRQTPEIYRAADGNDTFTLTYDIDTVLGTLRASWSFRNGAATFTGSSDTVQLGGDLLRAVQGDHTILTNLGERVESGLSVGIVASSRTATTPIDVDLLELTIEGIVADPEITLISQDSPLLGSRGVFNYIQNPDENNGVGNPDRAFKNSAVIEVRNDGLDVLSVSALSLDGPFRFLDVTDTSPFSLDIGQSRLIEIGFDSRPTAYDPESDPEVFTGELRVFSNDADEAVSVAELAGFWQVEPENGKEPSFNELMEVFGFGTRADQSKFANLGIYEQAGPDEVLSPYWRIADGYTEVTVTQLAAFHNISKAPFSIYEPGNGLLEESRVLMNHGDLYNQSLLPRLVTSNALPTITFDAGDIPDEWAEVEVFGIRAAGEFSDPRLNNEGPGTAPPGAQRGHFVRFFEAKDEAGNVIADTFIVAQDYNGSNFDYQDNVYLVRGIEVAEDLMIG